MPLCDHAALPTISVVTPSYNQAQFLEETIRSVLSQGYPRLEYIVIDGGSTDGSVEILERYSPWLHYWVSERDRGQSHAINKGFARASGDVHNWLNSDDLFMPGLLWRVADAWRRSDPHRFWYTTGLEYRDHETGDSALAWQDEWFNIDDWVTGGAQFNQQGAFWSRDLWTAAGPMDETMHFGFDKEFFAHLVALGYRYEVDRNFPGATYRQHKDCKWKTSASVFQYDWARISLRYLRRDHPERKRIRREMLGRMAYFHVRWAQDPLRSRLRRSRDLLAALRLQPSLLFDRSFLGTARRLATARSTE